MSPDSAALAVVDVAKSFGPTRALRGVNVEVAGGTIHALLGGNGSGKSTLVKILAGVYPADSGVICLDGQQLPVSSYRAADGHRHGLRFVHQDLGLISSATIAENIAFGQGFPTRFGPQIGWRQLRVRTRALLDQYEIDAGPQTLIAQLRPADRTMVAIARALSDGGASSETHRAVLVLDEPTASLPRHESDLLLAAIRRRAQNGQTIVLISHHLGEVLDVADEITVLRDGRTAGRLRAAEADEDAVVALMAGRAVTAVGRQEPTADKGAQPALRIRGLAAGPLQDVNLDVRAGEIVGVTGLLGSGRTSLVRAVFGDLTHRAGTVQVGAKTLTGASPVESIAAGVALVPEDRAGDAALADHTVGDNLAASVFASYWRRGWMRTRRQQRDSEALIERFGVRTQSALAPLSALSGGNQQKVILARWLRRTPRVLLLDEPTQGVDVVSRADIYRLIREVAAAGCAVLLVSSDAEELAIICDRVLVLADGEVADEVGHADLDADLLTRLTQTTHAARTESAHAVGATP